MAATFGQTATAQEANPDTIYRQFALDEVVVTGTRTPKFLKDTPIQTRGCYECAGSVAAGAAGSGILVCHEPTDPS